MVVDEVLFFLMQLLAAREDALPITFADGLILDVELLKVFEQGVLRISTVLSKARATSL